MHSKLSIILLTFNEESNIPELKENLAGINVPIYVVDSYSTDKTIDLINEIGWKLDQHPFENYARQRNWAQQQNPFNTEWVLHLDADERLTSELKKWLINDFDPNKADVDGYMFGRRAIFMGQWIKSHYNYHLRLYKAGKGNCEDKAYDQHYVVDGWVEVIKKKDLTSKVCDTINEFVIKHARWAELEAEEIVQASIEGDVKTNLWGTPIERKRWLKKRVFEASPLFVRSFLYFFYRYFLLLGFLDGKRGFIFHILQAFWFRFLVDAKVYEKRNKI